MYKVNYTIQRCSSTIPTSKSLLIVSNFSTTQREAKLIPVDVMKWSLPNDTPERSLSKSVSFCEEVKMN